MVLGDAFIAAAVGAEVFTIGQVNIWADSRPAENALSTLAFHSLSEGLCYPNREQ